MRALVLGAGLAGLAAAYRLSQEGWEVLVLERAPCVGGLARTVVHRGFRFDLGGHRFLTSNPATLRLVQGLLQGQLLTVRRRSQIYLSGRYLHYPLRPLDALAGLGPGESLQVLAHYFLARLGHVLRPQQPRSLQDWVVGKFGRRLFELYFRDYSEKLWGTDCRRISARWVAQRIQGLSLGQAIREALLRGKDTPRTLKEEFLYPPLGIGQIAEGFKEAVLARGAKVLTGTSVREVHHLGGHISHVLAEGPEGARRLEADVLISTIPLSALLRALRPRPRTRPPGLRYRALIVVAVLLGRPRCTELTWLYFPERRVPFGRLHEPGNWSPLMAPEGRTHLVLEYFCTQGDYLWQASDRALARLSVEALKQLGFIRQEDVLDALVLRVPHAYPFFEVGYEALREEAFKALEGLEGLLLAGRTGQFRYLNMDHAIESGLEAASRALARAPQAVGAP
jgi:protoporphyrinogen oxidase